MMNDDWIFSDEAHDWMDHCRDRTAPFSYQRSYIFHSPDFPRIGWEHGLFGFKPLEWHSKQYQVLYSHGDDGVIL